MSKINLSRSKNIAESRGIAVLRLDRHEFTKGEPVVIYYRSSGNDVDYVFAIGTDNGVGKYKIVTTGQQEIVWSVSDSLPDISTLVNGEIRLYHDTSTDLWYSVSLNQEEGTRKIVELSSVPKIFIDLEDNSIWVSDEDRKARRLNSIYSKDEIDKMISDIKKGILLTTLSYSQFKALVSESALIPGMYYLVQRYTTTIKSSLSGVESDGNELDLLLHAISRDDVEENGVALFPDSQDPSFTIRFSLNKEGEYTWSDDPVIFWMKDRDGNEAPFDFYNISWGGGKKAFDTSGGVEYHDCVISGESKELPLVSLYRNMSPEELLTYHPWVLESVYDGNTDVTQTAGNVMTLDSSSISGIAFDCSANDGKVYDYYYGEGLIDPNLSGAETWSYSGGDRELVFSEGGYPLVIVSDPGRNASFQVITLNHHKLSLSGINSYQINFHATGGETIKVYHVTVDPGVRNKNIDISSLAGNRYEVRVSLRSDGEVVMYCPADMIDNVI